MPVEQTLGGGEAEASTRPRRPQPIRDTILRFLTEPRSAADIAEHIARPVPTATGHLAAMTRLGLVQRLAFGTYAAATYSGPKLKLPNRRSHSPKELRQRLRDLLCERRGVLDLCLRAGASEADVRLALKELWLSGLIQGADEIGYSLARRQDEGQ
jgi:hypothetical protein